MLNNVACLTAYLIVLGPIAYILYDLLIWFCFGYHPTITGVIRTWNTYSSWPEVVFVLGAVVLYGHFFRKWL